MPEPDPDVSPRRLPFTQQFPRDDALDALVGAFERGDLARVRRDAPSLAKGASSVEVRDAAVELLARTSPHRAAIPLFILAVLLLVFLSLAAMHR